MPRNRKQTNPHAELCAWANGLRPDSPQYDQAEGEALADDADREMLGDDADVLGNAGYGVIGSK